jgi:hypothetical protein
MEALQISMGSSFVYAGSLLSASHATCCLHGEIVTVSGCFVVRVVAISATTKRHFSMRCRSDVTDFSGQDVGASTTRTKYDLESRAARDDKGGGLVVERYQSSALVFQTDFGLE